MRTRPARNGEKPGGILFKIYRRNFQRDASVLHHDVATSRAVDENQGKGDQHVSLHADRKQTLASEWRKTRKPGCVGRAGLHHRPTPPRVRFVPAPTTAWPMCCLREPGGYTGFNALYGPKYMNQVLGPILD